MLRGWTDVPSHIGLHSRYQWNSLRPLHAQAVQLRQEAAQSDTFQAADLTITEQKSKPEAEPPNY